jgi:hypothetical protein
VYSLSEQLGLGVGWIELAADPLQALDVLLVFRIRDRIEELAVSPGAADILWWAATDRFDEAWVVNAGRGIGNALDTDGMFPAVTEVVEVFGGGG